MTSEQAAQSATAGPQDAFSAPLRGWVEREAGAPTGSATRHLCAAAYLDRDFRNRAIEELVEHSYRVPAPTPGTDAGRVLEACLQARKAAVVRGVVFLVIGLLGLVLSGGALLLVVGTLISLRVVSVV